MFDLRSMKENLGCCFHFYVEAFLQSNDFLLLLNLVLFEDCSRVG